MFFFYLKYFCVVLHCINKHANKKPGDIRIMIGIYSTDNKMFDVFNNEYGVYEDNEYIITIHGLVMLNKEKADYEEIKRLYVKVKDKIVDFLNGMYYLIIYDKNIKKVNVYQDYYNSGEVLYIMHGSNRIGISNSLKELIYDFNEEVSIDKKSRLYFLNQGFVPGKETLLKQVHKLKPFCKLIIDGDDCIYEHINYNFDVPCEADALRNWGNRLDDAIEESISDLEEICIPISSGYDSNYILSYLNKNTGKDINMYTIGGYDGVDESGIVRNNLRYYDSRRNMLTTTYTTPKSLGMLGDIVWRLDGAVYEKGIFLQYELASVIAAGRYRHIVCGEGADQIMHIDYDINGNEYDEFFLRDKINRHPYIFSSSIIMKKSAIMLRSFGIEGRYPYMNQKFAQTAFALRKLNGKDKTFHKEYCGEYLPQVILKNTQKVGGTTSLHSLFNDKYEIKEFLSYIENTKMFRKYQPIIDSKHRNDIKTRDTIGSFKTDFLPKVRAKIKTDKLAAFTPGYRACERRIDRAVRYAYMMAFEKIFASSEYRATIKSGIKGSNVYKIL